MLTPQAGSAFAVSSSSDSDSFSFGNKSRAQQELNPDLCAVCQRDLCALLLLSLFNKLDAKQHSNCLTDYCHSIFINTLKDRNLFFSLLVPLLCRCTKCDTGSDNLPKATQLGSSGARPR